MNIALLRDFVVRPARLADAESVVNLLTAIACEEEPEQAANLSLAEEDSERTVAATLAFWRTLDLVHDTQVVVAPDESIVGYIDVGMMFRNAEHTDRCVRIRHVSGVHPDYTGRGIGTWLLHFAQWWTQQHSSGEPMRIVAWIHHRNERARHLLIREGYVYRGDHTYRALQLNEQARQRLVSQYTSYSKVVTPDMLVVLCRGVKGERQDTLNS
ncbi:GNAT family N-acetyltransferase [Dictyobacter aurantiacus]|nr:GNAT family N-acetyltransferase [Dictyobacter aurantiacus]